MTIHRRRILFPLLMAVLLMALASGVALGKAHVPANQVQVLHKEVVRQVSAEALEGHLNHGDFQLPACDFNNVFLKGGSAPGVADTNGDGFADTGLDPRSDAGGLTPACPPGTF